MAIGKEMDWLSKSFAAWRLGVTLRFEAEGSVKKVNHAKTQRCNQNERNGVAGAREILLKLHDVGDSTARGAKVLGFFFVSL